jgi:hypothetical protein
LSTPSSGSEGSCRQEQGGFEVLNLPAIAQREETYDLGGGRTYRRRKGELLKKTISRRAAIVTWRNARQRPSLQRGETDSVAGVRGLELKNASARRI